MTEEEKDAYIKKLLTSNIDQHNKISFLSKKVQDLQKQNGELKSQIEKMKNCKNCANYMISEKCPCFFKTGWCKNWEMTKGVSND